MSRPGLLIVAAGASSRLGQPKQLLNLHGKPLIRHMAEVAIASGCAPVGVVLGAYATAIQPHLADLPCHSFNNPDWATGMASSIRCGLRNLLALAPDLEAIILMVGDQPFVSPHLLRQLIAQHATSHCPIIAAEYAGILGVPSLFHRRFFPHLAALQGDVGARAILQQQRSHCLRIPFPEGAMDLDTPDDVQGFIQAYPSVASVQAGTGLLGARGVSP